MVNKPNQQVAKHDMLRILLEIAATNAEGIMFKTKRGEADYLKKQIGVLKSQERKRTRQLGQSNPLYNKTPWDSLLVTIQDHETDPDLVYFSIVDGIENINKMFTFVDPNTKEERDLYDIIGGGNDE